MPLIVEGIRENSPEAVRWFARLFGIDKPAVEGRGEITEGDHEGSDTATDGDCAAG
mgnify:CR=1 FL=1